MSFFFCRFSYGDTAFLSQSAVQGWTVFETLTSFHFFQSLSPALGGIEASQTDRQRGGEIWWTPLDTWQPIFVLCWKTSCVGQKIQEGNTQTRLSTIPWHEHISVQRSESQSEPNWNTFAKLFWCQLRDICSTVKQFHWSELGVCMCVFVLQIQRRHM